MGSGAVDSSQWLSVKEETIFLHDGLIRVTDLAELPSEIGVSEQGDTEQEVGEIHLSLKHIHTHTHTHTHTKVLYIESHARCCASCVFQCLLLQTIRHKGRAHVSKSTALSQTCC